MRKTRLKSMSDKKRAALLDPATRAKKLKIQRDRQAAARSLRQNKQGRKPIKKKPRKPSEFNRIYGSRARVKWVKSLDCIACVAFSVFFARGNSENAHTVTGGTGYKAGFETIVPLCHSHHERYDQHRLPFDRREARQWVKDAAPRIEALWQAELARRAA